LPRRFKPPRLLAPKHRLAVSGGEAAKAEHRGAILLFDEVDALFGTRSDVKHSHDRYAGIEAGYLLQWTEGQPEVRLFENPAARLSADFVNEPPAPDDPNERDQLAVREPRRDPLAPDRDLLDPRFLERPPICPRERRAVSDLDVSDAFAVDQLAEGLAHVGAAPRSEGPSPTVRDLLDLPFRVVECVCEVRSDPLA